MRNSFSQVMARSSSPRTPARSRTTESAAVRRSLRRWSLRRELAHSDQRDRTQSPPRPRRRGSSSTGRRLRPPPRLPKPPRRETQDQDRRVPTRKLISAAPKLPTELEMTLFAGACAATAHPRPRSAHGDLLPHFARAILAGAHVYLGGGSISKASAIPGARFQRHAPPRLGTLEEQSSGSEAPSRVRRGRGAARHDSAPWPP